MVLLFLICAGLVTYYYHLSEPLDGDEETQMTATGQVFSEKRTHLERELDFPGHGPALPCSTLKVDEMQICANFERKTESQVSAI